MLFFKLKIFRLSDCRHEPSDKEVHIDEYVNGTETKTPDGKCDVCEWAMSVSATCTVTISEPPQTVEVTHTLDVANLTAAGLAVGSGGAINTTIDGFTNGSVKLSNKVDGYISSNGGTITFTTQSDNAVFKIKFQAKASTRGITISGPEGFSASQYETAANTEFTIELGKAGTYTINTVGGEVKFFYMSYTHMEPIVN